LDEVTRQSDAVGLAHLARDRELDFTGELRVFAQFCRLDIVPELLSVAPLLGRPVG